LDCQEIQAKLYLRVDGELPAEEMAAVDAHLRACPHCASFFRRLEQENRNLSALLATPSLEGTEIRRLERRLLRKLALPRRATRAEHAASILQRFSVIGLVLVAYIVVKIVHVDTAGMYRQLAVSLISGHYVPVLLLNLAAALITVLIIVIILGRLNWLFDHNEKGGSLSCL
jgi:anti-sigma factor RsiW